MPRKKTHEEFVAEMAAVNPDVKVVGTYAGNKAGIELVCLVCGHGWAPSASSALAGHGCPECAKRRRAEKRTLTHDGFVAGLPDGLDVELLGRYVNSETKIPARCTVCGHEWDAWPACLRRGQACPKCSKERASRKARKRPEQFTSEMEELHPTIRTTTPYVNAKTPVHCICTVCGHGWDATPNKLQQGTGCPRCGGSMKLTQEEFTARLAAANPGVRALDGYVNNGTPIRFECLACGHVWKVKPAHVLAGHGCKRCATRNNPANQPMAEEAFLARLAQISPRIEAVGHYVNIGTPIACRCMDCGHGWEPTPRSLLKGHGCSVCNKADIPHARSFLGFADGSCVYAFAGRKARSNTGIIGVSQLKDGSYCMHITFKGVKVKRNFKTLEEAREARKEAEEEPKEFVRGYYGKRGIEMPENVREWVESD